MIKIGAEQIWNEYERLKEKNSAQGFYETVRKNENFYIGRQWEGVNAPRGLEKPVFNILKRVVSYFISMVASDDVSVQLSLFGGERNGPAGRVLEAASAEVERVIEQAKVKAKNRDAIRNAAVDGDACFYLRFDPEGGDGGEIDVEVLDNTNVLFGNPQVWEVQKQPAILIVSQRMTEDVCAEASLRGISHEGIERIRACGKESGSVVVLTRLFRKDGTIHMAKAVGKELLLQPEIDLGYRLYPLAWFSWDKIKNSYHGQSAVTGLIPNQIFINKLFAMSMEHVRNMAFPKVVYNRNFLPDGWNNRVGSAIGVAGDPNLAVATGFKAPDMSSQVMLLIEKVIEYTRDTMGASDAALGNIKPENTSAIIAVQKASAMPLELQKMSFYQFVEDYVRIFLEMMRVNYGIRRCLAGKESGREERIDFSRLGEIRYKLNIDVGASSYWSEMMQVQTIDNLFAKGVVTDAVSYLESIPDGYIRNKQKMIAKLQEERDRLAEKSGQLPGQQGLKADQPQT
jgi:hypothetical protein